VIAAIAQRRLRGHNVPRRLKPEPEIDRMRHVLALALAALLPSLALAQSKQTANTLKLDARENMPKATIADAAWLAGHWAGEGLGGFAEEVWSPPHGNSMMGMFRVVGKDGKVTLHEILTLVERDGSLVLKLKHFDADL
jgi:hypothetical protein